MNGGNPDNSSNLARISTRSAITTPAAKQVRANGLRGVLQGMTDSTKKRPPVQTPKEFLAARMQHMPERYEHAVRSVVSRDSPALLAAKSIRLADDSARLEKPRSFSVHGKTTKSVRTPRMRTADP
jgi:hypothetical protein